MRKIALILLLMAAMPAMAQLSVGVRAGYGVFGVDFEPPSLNGNQVNLYEPNFGIVGIFNNENNFGVQLEVNYAVKGWREEDEDIPGSEYKHEITYLEVPFMTHFELGKRNLRVFGLFGPYIAFKQDDKASSKNYDAVMKNPQFNPYVQTVRDFDFGNKVGGGIRYNIGRVSVFADVRYDLQIAGGQNIFKKHPDKIQTSRLKELSGSVGLVFNIRNQKVVEEKEYYVPKEGMDTGIEYF
ncbi:MAG: PorT family protein [Salinivirgaceae bacterium]|nr:PorT family protein [Salinivirgaceae bacterium]